VVRRCRSHSGRAGTDEVRLGGDGRGSAPKSIMRYMWVSAPKSIMLTMGSE